jgi:[CysO sulfur-carrier protein]-S-L-cysteine hydrolase
MLEKLILTDDLVVQVGGHARTCLPQEACGLLAGNGVHATTFLPVKNELGSPTAFRMDAQEQLIAFLWMEEQSLDLLAIFHSHPNGPQIPSANDLAEFSYPYVACLIWTPFSLRAFNITANGFDEIPLMIDSASI